jgi:SAM-dependent methyltransferase
MPKDLSGKSVLDLGCNEGFFSIEASKRGAARVVGIDQNPGFLAKARQRAPEITFLERSWRDLPDEKFDLILMLSALHYEGQPRDFLRRVSDRLKDDGLLILEVGVANEPGMTRMWTQRINTVFHPTWDMLHARYLEPFAFRVIGRSVDQPGDPVPRWVVHCRRLKPTVVLVTGPGQVGKSSLARELSRGQVVTLEIDIILRRVSATMTKVDRPLFEVIDHYRDQVPKSYRKMVDGILAAGLAEEFAELIFSHIPLDEELVIVEGYGLHGEVLSRLEERLRDVAYVWQTSRLEPADEQLSALLEEKASLQSRLDKSALDAERANFTLEQVTQELDRARAQLEDLERGNDELIGKVDETTMALNSTVEERDLAIQRLARLKQRRSVRIALRAADWTKPFIRKNSG